MKAMIIRLHTKCAFPIHMVKKITQVGVDRIISSMNNINEY